MVFHSEPCQGAFKALDQDDDGLVSAREFRADAAAYSYSTFSADECVSFGDADGDGKLSGQEFFRTLVDPNNREGVQRWWRDWFALHRDIAAEGGTQLSRPRKRKKAKQ